MTATVSTTGNSVCIGCGARFDCGADSGHCWCMELPALPMSPESAGCYCPACLKGEIDRHQTSHVRRAGASQG